MVESFVQGAAAMVPDHGLLQLFPEARDAIDPGVVSRLEQQLEPGIFRQPSTRLVTTMNDVVVDDQHDAPGPAVGGSQAAQQGQEQVHILALTVTPD